MVYNESRSLQTGTSNECGNLELSEASPSYQESDDLTVELQQQEEATNGGEAPSHDDTMLVLTVDQAIDRIGHGRFQLQVLIATGLCFAADAMEVLLLSFLGVVLQVEWGLSSEQTALLTSLVFIGALVGTCVLGYLGDRLGRRPIFILAATIISVFGLATSVCSNFYALCATRVMVGFGVGGLTIPFDILSEVLAQDARGKNLLYIDYFWTAGTLLVPLFASLTIAEGQTVGAWRSFVALCSVPCLLSAVLGSWLVPESPRWLVTIGQPMRALEILKQAAVTNGKNVNEVFPEGTVLQEEENVHHKEESVCDLFSPRWRKITLLMWILWGSGAFMYYGNILATTLVFADEEETQAGDDTTEESFDFDYSAFFVTCSAEIFGTTFAILLIDRMGRTRLQSLSYFLGGLFVAIMLYLDNDDEEDQSSNHRILSIAVAFGARWFLMSATCTTWVGTAEVLPTEIRTTGHSTSNAIGKLGGFVAPYLVQEDTPPSHIATTMLILAMITVATVSGLPETKGRAMGGIIVTDDGDDDDVLQQAARDEQGSIVEIS